MEAPKSAVSAAATVTTTGESAWQSWISKVRDALGLGASAACRFEDIGNCGQHPTQKETSIADLQTATVRSLRGCNGCPLIFGKGDFNSGCVFRGHVELIDRRKLPAVMRVNEAAVIVELTESQGRLNIFYNAVLIGLPTPTPRIRPGRVFVGRFEIGPEDVLLITNGRLEIADDGTTLTLDFETPRFRVKRITATYDPGCIWSTYGGCQ